MRTRRREWHGYNLVTSGLQENSVADSESDEEDDVGELLLHVPANSAPRHRVKAAL